MGNFVVVGASRGIGGAVAEHLAAQGHQLVTVSRSPSTVGRWIKADVSIRESIEAVHSAVDGAVLDGLLYMGGIWETNAFTSDYSFERCSDRDIETVIGVNLVAPIRLVQALLPNLRRSNNPKIVFMGALSGLDNFSGREVVNTASKFGLRGVVHALREELRKDNIAVSVINPGNVGTPEVLGDLKEAGEMEDSVIPLPDLLSVLDCILAVSRSTCIKEVQMPAMQDRGA
ncbi:MAG: SDR family oxidoreductase [Cyanobacteria bacterium P01_C01_bin.89]